MNKYNYIFSLLLILFIFSSSQKTFAQFGEFDIFPCNDSAAVISLFDSVFFRQIPPENITNLSFYGDPASVGYYVSGAFLGFESSEGIILTTGFSNDGNKSNSCNTSANASSNNNGIANDPDLQSLANENISNDGCIIEFDFKPITNIVKFNYVFASEEYHEYVFDMFNDVFGLFLSGPGISGPFTNNADNIATLPNTNMPVSINNVNYGKGNLNCTGTPTGCTNCQWFRDNSQNTDPFFNRFVYDGLTVALPCNSSLQHGEWYHIKLAIGDATDAAFDSALLLEKGSFNTGSITSVIRPMRMD